MATFKNPLEQSKALQSEESKKRIADISSSPLREFQAFEDANYLGSLWDDDRDYFGINTVSNGYTPYPELLNAYKKSKGKYAGNIDPEVQKYFDSQLAKRQSIADRFKKIPANKSEEFQRGLGWHLDPFDFSEEDFIPEDLQNGSTLLDWNPHDWDYIIDYLNKQGY